MLYDQQSITIEDILRDFQVFWIQKSLDALLINIAKRYFPLTLQPCDFPARLFPDLMDENTEDTSVNGKAIYLDFQSITNTSDYDYFQQQLSEDKKDFLKSLLIDVPNELAVLQYLTKTDTHTIENTPILLLTDSVFILIFKAICDDKYWNQSPREQRLANFANYINQIDFQQPYDIKRFLLAFFLSGYDNFQPPQNEQQFIDNETHYFFNQLMQKKPINGKGLDKDTSNTLYWPWQQNMVPSSSLSDEVLSLLGDFLQESYLTIGINPSEKIKQTINDYCSELHLSELGVHLDAYLIPINEWLINCQPYLLHTHKGIQAKPGSPYTNSINQIIDWLNNTFNRNNQKHWDKLNDLLQTFRVWHLLDSWEYSLINTKTCTQDQLDEWNHFKQHKNLIALTQRPMLTIMRESLEEKIHQLPDKMHQSWIHHFFTSWAEAKYTSEHAELFSQLLSDSVMTAIKLLTDKTLLDWQTSTTDKDDFIATLEQINHSLLYALTVPFTQWSPSFTDFFDQILIVRVQALIEQEKKADLHAHDKKTWYQTLLIPIANLSDWFNNQHPLASHDVEKTAYPSPLLHQLNSLKFDDISDVAVDIPVSRFSKTENGKKQLLNFMLYSVNEATLCNILQDWSNEELNTPINDQRDTWLILAARYSLKKILYYLCERNVNLLQANGKGITALNESNCRYGCLNILLDAIEQSSLKDKKKALFARNFYGDTILHETIYDIKSLQRVLATVSTLPTLDQVTLLSTTNSFDKTALHLAISLGRVSPYVQILNDTALENFKTRKAGYDSVTPSIIYPLLDSEFSTKISEMKDSAFIRLLKFIAPFDESDRVKLLGGKTGHETLLHTAIRYPENLQPLLQAIDELSENNQIKLLESSEQQEREILLHSAVKCPDSLPLLWPSIAKLPKPIQFALLTAKNADNLSVLDLMYPDLFKQNHKISDDILSDLFNDLFNKMPSPESDFFNPNNKSQKDSLKYSNFLLRHGIYAQDASSEAFNTEKQEKKVTTNTRPG